MKCKMAIPRKIRTVMLVLALPSMAWAQNSGSNSVPDPVVTTRSADVSLGGEYPGSDYPDSPGSVIARLQASDTIGPQGASPATAPGNPETPQPVAQTSQKPVGTAAAEPMRANGIAASQPAGVAVAPGKQRRVRTIVIAIGAVLGAGVALGSIAALTAGTASRPPGGH
jgi:hypothetical protein